jgi:hypothetical protein
MSRNNDAYLAQAYGHPQQYGACAGASVGAFGMSQTLADRADCNVVDRTGEVLHETERAERTLRGLQKAVEEMGARLGGSVMRPEAPTPCETKGELRGAPQTPMGSRLAVLANDLAFLNARVESFLARLEV